MDRRTATSELDRTTGRTAAPPAQGRARRQPPRPRWAPIAAAVLVGALAVGWLAVSARSGASNAVPIARAAAVPSTTSRAADTSALRSRLRDASQCADVVTAEPEVVCSIGDVRVDIRLLDGDRAGAEYAAVVGRSSFAAAAGPPACAAGRPDERSWARPSAPTRAVGRYLCRVDNGAAAMWWTEGDGLFVHATAVDADLAGLFRWWRTHPLE